MARRLVGVSQELPVRRPGGMRVPADSERQLPGLSAGGWKNPYFPENARCDLSPVGRNSRILRALLDDNNPFRRAGLGKGRVRERKKNDSQKSDVRFHFHETLL